MPYLNKFPYLYNAPGLSDLTYFDRMTKEQIDGLAKHMGFNKCEYKVTPGELTFKAIEKVDIPEKYRALGWTSNEFQHSMTMYNFWVVNHYSVDAHRYANSVPNPMDVFADRNILNEETIKYREYMSNIFLDYAENAIKFDIAQLLDHKRDAKQRIPYVEEQVENLLQELQGLQGSIDFVDEEVEKLNGLLTPENQPNKQ